MIFIGIQASGEGVYDTWDADDDGAINQEEYERSYYGWF